MLNTGSKPVQSNHQLLTTVAYRIGAKCALCTGRFDLRCRGAAVQWLRDGIGIIGPPLRPKLAAALEDNRGVYLVPAFTGLGAPGRDPMRARGAIFGLTRDSGVAS